MPRQKKVKTKYTQKELKEFQKLIEVKIEEAKQELKYYQDQITKKDNLGSSDSKFKELSDGTVTAEKEYLNQMAARQLKLVTHLKKALVRIENQTYGICRDTGKLISKERLKAVPHATLSIEAKKAQKS